MCTRPQRKGNVNATAKECDLGDAPMKKFRRGRPTAPHTFLSQKIPKNGTEGMCKKCKKALAGTFQNCYNVGEELRLVRIAALERLAELRAKIEKSTELEKELRAAAERMTLLLSAMPNASPSAYSRVEEYTLKVLQEQENRQRFELELLSEQARLSEKIAKAVEKKSVRQIMRKRYIEGKSWRAIGAELYCSPRQALRLNRTGIKQLGAVLSS